MRKDLFDLMMMMMNTSIGVYFNIVMNICQHGWKMMKSEEIKHDYYGLFR